MLLNNPGRLGKLLLWAWQQSSGIREIFEYSEDKEQREEEQFLGMMIQQLAPGDKQKAILEMLAASYTSANIQNFSQVLEKESKESAKLTQKMLRTNNIIMWSTAILAAATTFLAWSTWLLVSEQAQQLQIEHTRQPNQNKPLCGH